MWQLITVCISFAIFLIYNITALSIFGVPKSLSDTFYLYNSKKDKLGYIFTVFMCIMGMTLLPGWLEIGEVWSSWSMHLNSLAFFTSGAICFVGVAPAFRSSKMEGTVHEVSAKIAAAAALLWCFIVCWNIFYVPLVGAAIPAIVGLCTKSWKRAQVYWLEMMAFGATYATVITAASLLIN